MNKELSMPKRYRLLARAQIDGEVRDPGYVFTLADGQSGPQRTVVASQHGAQIVDHIASEQQLVDQPLYEEIVDDVPGEPAPVEKPAAPTADELQAALAAANSRVAGLEHELADLEGRLAHANQRLAAITNAVAAAHRETTAAPQESAEPTPQAG
jgi:hypothetical protein